MDVDLYITLAHHVPSHNKCNDKIVRAETCPGDMRHLSLYEGAESTFRGVERAMCHAQARFFRQGAEGATSRAGTFCSLKERNIAGPTHTRTHGESERQTVSARNLGRGSSEISYRIF